MTRAAWLRLLGAVALVGAILAPPYVGEPNESAVVDGWTRALLWMEGCTIRFAAPHQAFHPMSFTCRGIACVEFYFVRDERPAYRLQCSDAARGMGALTER